MANEKRLIDANDVYALFAQNGMARLHVADIDAIPRVDAVEVVHGEWEIIEDDYFDLVEMKCSVCGESYGFEDYEDDTPKNYHYCPNCGAKMDGEEKDSNLLFADMEEIIDA